MTGTLEPLAQKPNPESQENANDDEVTTVVQGDSGSRYKILEVIGKGGFGIVYRAIREIDTETEKGVPRMVQQFAVKTEQGSSIRLEIDVLKAAQGKVHFCKLWDCGYDEGISYIVMSLLGPNILQARNEICHRRFSLSTSVRVAMQTLNAVEELHSIGFLSRDVKPSNFALGRFNSENRRLIYMLDFGIARRYVDENGDLLPQREKGGWRGTSRYCSLNIHKKMDQSRRDDIESWFYMVVELTAGHLLWGHLMRSQKPEIAELKSLARNLHRRTFLARCPQEYDVIFDVIDRWEFACEPDYNGLYVCLMRVMKSNKIDFDDPYDWEKSEGAAEKFDRRNRAPHVAKDCVKSKLSYAKRK